MPNNNRQKETNTRSKLQLNSPDTLLNISAPKADKLSIGAESLHDILPK